MHAKRLPLGDVVGQHVAILTDILQILFGRLGRLAFVDVIRVDEVILSAILDVLGRARRVAFGDVVGMDATILMDVLDAANWT